MKGLRHKVFAVFFCSILALCDAHAAGFYVADLDRDYDDMEYSPPRRYRPRPKRVYAYRDSPPPRRYRPRAKKVYVYREPPPPPRARPQLKEVRIYQDPQPQVYAYNPPPPPMTPSPPSPVYPPYPQNSTSMYPGFAQNNFLLFKLGGFKTNDFSGNANISSSSNGYILGIGVGHYLSRYTNVSLELDHFSNSESTAPNRGENKYRAWDLSSNMITVNAAISVFPDQPVDFYVKAGFGLSYNKSGTYRWYSGRAEYSCPGESNMDLAWRGGFGVKFNVMPEIDAGLEYMFTNRGKFKTQGNCTVGNTATSIDPKNVDFTDHTISLVVSKKIS